nr:NADH dehydrogenase subunit 2 [Bairdiella chrysoura]
MTPMMCAFLLFTLGLGTTISFASSHWFFAWMGLEINTLAILPLMAHPHHPRAVEATLKYFVTQATAASVLLFASLINAWLSGQWEIGHMTHPLPVTLFTLAFALKLGLAPLHTWLPEVLQGLDLGVGLIMSTWQKLAPFILLLQIHPSNSALLIILGLASTLVGGWGGINQTQLRKILAYSSIAHLGWMILILPFSPALTLITLIMYLIMTFSTFLVFVLINVTNINALAASWTKFPALTALMPLVLLSLAGLPPLSGFMPKWLILQELTKQNMGVTAVLAVFTALLSLYFYLRLSKAMTLTTAPNPHTGTTPWRIFSAEVLFPVAISVIMTIGLLPLIPTIIALLYP